MGQDKVSLPDCMVTCSHFHVWFHEMAPKRQTSLCSCRYDSEHFNTAGRSVKTGLHRHERCQVQSVCLAAIELITVMFTNFAREKLSFFKMVMSSTFNEIDLQD